MPISEDELQDIREAEAEYRYEDRERWNAFFDALENTLAPTPAPPAKQRQPENLNQKPITQPKPQPKPMPATKTPPSPLVLAERAHVLANLRAGIPPDQAPQLSSEQLLSRYGENSDTPFGRIRRTLAATFEGEALAAATQAVGEYASNPQEYARASLSVADVVKLALVDANLGIGLPASARTAIDAEQEAIAVLRSTKGLW
jgi:hypothetical protein